MGLSLEFYAGSRDRIVEAMQECDLDRLDCPEVTVAYADFSLHLEPGDLNLMSRAIGLAENREPLELMPFLTGIVDENGYGALEVGPDWVGHIATANPAHLEAFAVGWTELMSALHGESIEVNDGMRKAIFDLLSLCRLAVKSKAAVVHVWYT